MDFLKQVGSQLKNLWDETSILGRFGFVVITAIALLSIAGVGYWASQPEYIMLTNSLSSNEHRAAMSKLDAIGADYKPTPSGMGILVSRADHDKAQAAIGGESDSLWSQPGKPDPGRDLKQKEKEIAQSLESSPKIQSARVMLAQGRRSPFVRRNIEPSASVILGVHSSIDFGSRDANDVAEIVAAAVVGLRKDKVKVSVNGQFIPLPGAGNMADRQMQLERRDEDKIRDQLRAMPEIADAVVIVGIDLNNRKLETTTDDVDPDRSVVTQEQIEKSSAEPVVQKGLGADANIGRMAQRATQTKKKDDTTIITTEPSRKRIFESDPGGNILRKTASVLIIPEATEADETVAMTIDEPSVTKLVQSALGFDATRNDQLSVVVSTKPGTDPLQDFLPVTSTFSKYSEIARNGSLGIASLVAFILGLMIINKIRPVMVPAQAPPQVSRNDVVNRITSTIQNDPDAFARAIEMYLDKNPPEGGPVRTAA